MRRRPSLLLLPVLMLLSVAACTAAPRSGTVSGPYVGGGAGGSPGG